MERLQQAIADGIAAIQKDTEGIESVQAIAKILAWLAKRKLTEITPEQLEGAALRISGLCYELGQRAEFFRWKGERAYVSRKAEYARQILAADGTGPQKAAKAEEAIAKIREEEVYNLHLGRLLLNMQHSAGNVQTAIQSILASQRTRMTMMNRET